MSETAEENDKARRCSESSDSEYDPQYKPIISLPEVVVPTNEENEVELRKVRAKLYRWDARSDPPEWKERGTGELKFLHNTENHNVRIVMRRDKTLKVCANHFIVPWLELTPKSGTDRAYVYSVMADFADEQAKSEMFAVKFGSVQNAVSFKLAFEEAKEIVRTKCSLYLEDLLAERSSDEESEKGSLCYLEAKDDTEGVTEKLAELEVTKKEEVPEE